jgi:cell division protein ZipA
MPELRWILLGLGALFFIGLWWWETRRQRQAPDSQGSVRAPEFLPPRPSRPEPVRRATLPEESVPPADEPVELAHPAPPESIPGPEEEQVEWPEHVERLEPRLGDAAAAVGGPRREAPTISVEIDTSEDAPATATSPASAPAGAPPSVPERIVTIRVAAPPLERFDGGALLRALTDAGLAHGRFAIFHRDRPDGEPLFSVASLVEPGTFDLNSIEGQRFPGISLFTILRHPRDVIAVDEMLAAARQLAGELQGSLQDERGAPLGTHRLTELRESIAAWQRAASALR